MYKLLRIGVKYIIWSIINGWHVNTESAKIVNQCRSSYVKVGENVRQGGVISGLFYLVFINDVLTSQETLKKNNDIFHLNISSPEPVDDSLCINITSDRLQLILTYVLNIP